MVPVTDLIVPGPKFHASIHFVSLSLVETTMVQKWSQTELFCLEELQKCSISLIAS